MKLQELSAPTPSKQIAKVFESYFGSRIRFDQLTRGQTQSMLGKVRGILGEHRKTAQRHNSEQDPRYLQLVMMEQALSTRLQENVMPPAAGAAPATGGQPAVAGAIAKDPKLAAALKKSAAGQSLNPEEQKLVAGAAMMQAESRFRRMARRLNESEVQQAQVVLAAQDMVDQMQKMIEDTTSMQFKELPALVDSIRNQVGIDQATQFNTDVSGALSGLVQNLQGAKQQLETALGVVTGQTPAPVPGADLAPDAMAAAGQMPGGLPAGDLEAGVAAEPAAEMPPEEPAPAAALGRKRR